MTKTPPFEQAELADFFHRGDAFLGTANSLEPPLVPEFEDLDSSDDAVALFLRTPEQKARRRKFVKLVSGGMSVLAVGTVLAVVGSRIPESSERVLPATAGADGPTLVQPLVSASTPTRIDEARSTEPTAKAATGVPPAVAQVAGPAAVTTRNAPTASSANAVVTSSRGEGRRNVTLMTQSSEGVGQKSSLVTTSAAKARRVVRARPLSNDYRPPTAVFED